MRPEKRIYFPEVDGLRAVAILSVLFFHLDFSLFTGGFVGVDVFFVISGFLITRNITEDFHNGTFSFSRFYYRRVRRLFPALLVTIFVTFVLGVLILSPDHLARLSESLIYALLSLSNFYFHGEAGYFDTSSSFKPLLHFWSLAVEEQFYLVWPAVCVFLFQLKKTKYLIVGLLVFGAISIVVSEYLLEEHATAVFYLTPFRIAEFSIGAVCVWAINNQYKNWLYETGLVLGLALIAVSVFTFNEKTSFPGVSSLVPCIGAALVILSGKAKYSGIILRNKPMLRIGVISYSMYLVHWPILIYYSYIDLVDLTSIEKITLVLATIIFAELMYRFVEQPFRYNPRSTTQFSSVQFFTMAMVVVAVTVIPAINAYTHNGWQWRVAEQENTDSNASDFECRDIVRLSKHERFCTAGSENYDAEKVLVIGDSHAGHLITALDYFGKKYNLKIDVWRHSGCPPLWKTYRAYTSGTKRQESCRELMPRWENATANGKYDYIIIASRWMVLYEPERYGDMKISRSYLVDRDNPVLDVNVSRELFASRLEMTVNKINESGAKAIIFSQVPLIGKNIQDCNDIPSYIISDERIRARCVHNVEFEDIMERLRFTDATVKSLSSENVLSIIPSNYLCDSDTRSCKTVIDGVLLYHDSNHLSKDGSLLFAGMIENKLAEFIKGR